MPDTNKSFDIEWFIDLPDKPWCWQNISLNPNFQIDWVINYPDFPWDWENLSINPKLDIGWLNKLPNGKWNWVIMATDNENLTFDIVNKYFVPKDFGTINSYIWRSILNNNFDIDRNNYITEETE